MGARPHLDPVNTQGTPWEGCARGERFPDVDTLGQEYSSHQLCQQVRTGHTLVQIQKVLGYREWGLRGSRNRLLQAYLVRQDGRVRLGPELPQQF